MISRLYIDKFRCFVNFEHKPARRELILGANGSGKSSFLDALLLLRQFVMTGVVFDDFSLLRQRTRWLNQDQLTCELEAVLDDSRYTYRLVIEPWGEPVKPRVASETVHLDGKPILEGFSFLQLEPAGENVRLLAAEFTDSGGKTTKFYFNELSDGQRCLICLYTILHFVLAKGNTVILDEPDNFISLREIQPWLTAITDAVEGGQGQILLISHHPEAINQWAPKNGVQFVREGIGPVHVKEFRGDPNTCLPPSELLARGWERE